MKKFIVLFLLIFLTSNSKAQYCENKKVNEFICEWLGTPYRFGGTNKKTGVDCSFFTKVFYITIFDVSLERVAKSQWEQTKRILKTELKIGDLVFFNSKVSPSGWHVGIFIGNNRFVHAANYIEGVKISDLCDEKYLRIYKGAGRYINNL